MTRRGFFVIPVGMSIKSLSTTFLILFLLACTSTYTVKNRALFLSAEKFDNEVLALSKENFVDLEQQKVFADFVKKNSRIEIDQVEVKGDEATANLRIHTISKSIYPEFKTVSGKDWKAKADAAMEYRNYSLTLKKSNDSWQIVDQKEIPK